jgi:hypothetical protein
MGQAALTGLGHVSAMPGAVDAAAGLLQHGRQAAQRAALLAAQRKAMEAAKLRNQDLKEKRQDDLVNAAAVMTRPFPGCTRPCISPVGVHEPADGLLFLPSLPDIQREFLLMLHVCVQDGDDEDENNVYEPYRCRPSSPCLGMLIMLSPGNTSLPHIAS